MLFLLVDAIMGEKGFVHFSSDVIDVAENAGSVLVNISRTTGGDQQQMVRYRLIPGTAMEGEQYDPIGGIIEFTIVDVQSIEIAIFHDHQFRQGDPQTFMVHLYSAQGLDIVPPSFCLIRIHDIDTDVQVGFRSPHKSLYLGDSLMLEMELARSGTSNGIVEVNLLADERHINLLTPVVIWGEDDFEGKDVVIDFDGDIDPSVPTFQMMQVQARGEHISWGYRTVDIFVVHGHWKDVFERSDKAVIEVIVNSSIVEEHQLVSDISAAISEGQSNHLKAFHFSVNASVIGIESIGSKVQVQIAGVDSSEAFLLLLLQVNDFNSYLLTQGIMTRFIIPSSSVLLHPKCISKKDCNLGTMTVVDEAKSSSSPLLHNAMYMVIISTCVFLIMTMSLYSIWIYRKRRRESNDSLPQMKTAVKRNSWFERAKHRRQNSCIRPPPPPSLDTVANLPPLAMNYETPLTAIPSADEIKPNQIDSHRRHTRNRSVSTLEFGLQIRPRSLNERGKRRPRFNSMFHHVTPESEATE